MTVLFRRQGDPDAANADMVFYLAGVDVAAGDRYGKLALTEEGIRQRDRCVIEAVRSRGVPLSIVLAGGYAPTRARTAELHAHAFREGAAYERCGVFLKANARAPIHVGQQPQRPNHQELEVLEEGGPLAFDGVADELADPSEHEQQHADAP
jgi:Histone deacetylase domain